jgi:hypothetical protein
MLGLVTRREAIKAMMATGISCGCGLSLPSSARGNGEVTKVWNTGNRDGFGPMVMKIYDITNEHNRLDVLGTALFELHTVFRDQKVYNNAYSLSVNNDGDKPVEYVYDEYWEKTNLVNHPQAEFRTPRMLLWNQSFFMKAADPFPTIHIKPFHEENDVWGYAYIGKVLTKWAPGEAGNVIIQGEFEVFVNTWHLGGGGINNWANMWASVIAHEMLHNLGHRHNKGEYVDGRQINAFHRAVYCRSRPDFKEYTGQQKIHGFG